MCHSSGLALKSPTSIRPVPAECVYRDARVVCGVCVCVCACKYVGVGAMSM